MKKRKTLATITIIVILLGICLVAVISPWRQIQRIAIQESVGVPKEEFVSKMEKLGEMYGSDVFQEQGETLFELAQDNGYNEYLLPAIMCIETLGGTRVKGDFNYWNSWNGWVINFTNFESPEESIETFFKILDTYYEGDNLKEFGEKWAPEVEGYAVNVYKIMEQIKRLQSRSRHWDFLVPFEFVKKG